MLKGVIGVVLAVIGAFAIGGIALHRNEPINALWLITAGVCVYIIGYRFYAAWVAARVLSVDATRATFRAWPRWKWTRPTRSASIAPCGVCCGTIPISS